jgi:phosphomannomutase
MYQCPGEPYQISRSVHLGRLAACYPSCAACPHRDDHGTLSKRQVRRLALVQPQALRREIHCDGESIGGTNGQRLNAHAARQAGHAFGTWLRTIIVTPGQRHASFAPRVLVTADGRACCEETVAEAVWGLRFAACEVIVAPPLDAATMGLELHAAQCDGGILLGNHSDRPYQVQLSCFGPDAMPLSQPGSLDAVLALWHDTPPRPGRRFGRLRRLRTSELKRDKLRTHFHALRPLRFVIQTTSPAVRRRFDALLRDAAPRMIAARELVPVESSWGASLQRVTTTDFHDRVDAGKQAHGANRASAENQAGYRDRAGNRDRANSAQREPAALSRLQEVGTLVHRQRAHFGISIEQDGQLLRLFDEQGREVPPRRWLPMLLSWLHARDARRTAVVVPQAAGEMIVELGASGVEVHRCSPSREAIYRAMRATGAALALDPRGHFWTADPRPCPDAVYAAALLLNVLSTSDAPLSEVIAAGAGQVAGNGIG